MSLRSSAFSPIILFYILWISAAVRAYIPAIPTNDTESAIQSGLNVTDVSTLSLLWYENGGTSPYSTNVAYQLVGAGSNGISQGALVHFSEKGLTNDATITPWIALISCDSNSTDASDINDVFTLARDRGAVSALLYSAYSSACIINAEYADPAHFDQVFDIFSTQSLTTARLIEERFDHIDRNTFGNFNAQRLNESFYLINSTLNNGNSTGRGYMFATLRSYNASEPNMTPTNSPANTSSDGNGQQRKKTSLAMIILYVITGCVSALFIIVIVSGAIRAFRHPERYGPRGIDPTNPDEYPQSRAKGLARAVLDTFPIVKFSRPEDEVRPTKDAETRGVELSNWEVVDTPRPSGDSDGSRWKAAGENLPPRKSSQETRAESSADGQLQRTVLKRSGTQASRQNPDVTPQTIGRETCPICIVDFEEGDDLRVLPCEGKHRFHQACVDPWLLELSSSCPLCREDFVALENMISGRSEDQHGVLENGHDHGHRPLSASGRGRFSRYLRFATRSRGSGFRHEYSMHYDPTYPQAPTQDERN